MTVVSLKGGGLIRLWLVVGVGGRSLLLPPTVRAWSSPPVPSPSSPSHHHQPGPARYYFQSLDELWQWTSPSRRRDDDDDDDDDDTVTNGAVPPSDGLVLPHRPRVLHCHDLGGGYTAGADQDYLATFSSWSRVDVLVYFGHYRVMMPPPVWIRACEQQQKILLGTFLWEGGKDRAPVRAFLETTEGWQRTADQLVSLCVHYGFHGWLINIETDVGVDRMAALADFLHYLTRKMKEKVGHHALVIYYDTHDQDGKFRPQNALLEQQNKALFDACDGIFLNYQWYEYDTLPRCKLEAGPDRHWDVYAGIDVWARNCDYTEGLGCRGAVETAIDKGVSLAVFAPGWVQEKGPGSTELPGSKAARDADDSFWNQLFAPAKIDN